MDIFFDLTCMHVVVRTKAFLRPVHSHFETKNCYKEHSVLFGSVPWSTDYGGGHICTAGYRQHLRRCLLMNCPLL